MEGAEILLKTPMLHTLPGANPFEYERQVGELSTVVG
jgi:hypothetical protein